jgi:hypothetical protein
MLLVDIERMCITEAPSNCEYFALSYVWGREPFLMLTKENESHLREGYRLLDEDLPQVFRDAMEVTRIFGASYLWIDALCIVQNDESRKREQLLQMDGIFEFASLTIISADGVNVRSSLTGLLPGTRQHHQSLPVLWEIGGLRFSPMPPSLDQDVTSEGQLWHTRGWTYQESMLSKRVLIFTSRQIYYICNLASCSEDSYFDPGLINSGRREGVSAIKNHPMYCGLDRHSLNARTQFRLTQHWFAYAYMIEDYSQRQFTYGSDVLKALVGILKAMTDPSVEKYICGLPASFIEWSLHWQPTGPVERREKASFGHSFPSWSWIGWKGAVKMPHLLNPGELIPVVSSWSFYTPIPGEARGHPSGPYSASEIRHSFIPYRPDFSPVDQPMPFHPTNWTGDRADTRLDTMHPLFENGVLEFTTAAAIFEIDSTSLANGYRSFPKSSTSSFAIRLEKDWVGTIHLPHSLARERLKGGRTKAEFILLCKTHVSLMWLRVDFAMGLTCPRTPTMRARERT